MMGSTVKFTASNLSKSVGACHCNMCRKWSSGPYMAVDCGTEVSYEGEDNLTIYDSSAWAERGFCKNCGSNIFYRLKESKQTMIAAGLFDDNSLFIFDHQVFIDKKPEFYNFENKTKNMTEAEVFAKYGGN